MTNLPAIGRSVLAAIWVALVLTAAWSPVFYREALVSAYFAFALAAAAIIHSAVWRKRGEALEAVLAGILLMAVAYGVLGFVPRLMAVVSYLGLGSLAVLGVRVAREVENRPRLLLAFAPALVFLGSEYVASDLLQYTRAVQTRVLDLYLLSFDGSLHTQLSALFGRAFRQWPVFRGFSLFFYVGLALPLGLVYAGHLRKRGARALPFMVATLAAGPAAIVMYNLFPAIGPHNLLGESFPFHGLSTEQARRLFVEAITVPGGECNAMPSLHMGWTLLAWWNARGLSWPRRMTALLFVVFTFVATLGTGEHWFIDLVVAVPFMVALQAACWFTTRWRDPRRWIPFASGGAAVATWLLLLRYATKLFWLSPAIPWGLAALTVVLFWWMQMRLDLTGYLAGRETAAAEPPVPGTQGQRSPQSAWRAER